MKLIRSAAAAVLAVAALGSAGLAQARDNIYWNIGIDAAPGVSVGVGNTRPVYVTPAPVYVAPPVYAAPPRVVVHPAPVYYSTGPVYYYQDHHRGRGHRKHRHHRHHRH